MPIHQIEYLDKKWESASRLARDGSDWIRIGIDRQRFQHRIEKTAEELDRILDFEFRQRIYQERFEKFVTTTNDTELTQNNLYNNNKQKDSIGVGLETATTTGETTQQPSVSDSVQQQQQHQQELHQPDWQPTGETNNANSNRRKSRRRGQRRRSRRRSNAGKSNYNRRKFTRRRRRKRRR